MCCFVGHHQQEHDTRHGSMSRTQWMIAGSDDTALEVEGRRFSTNDEGAPMLCNLVCATMGRHIHIDDCRMADAAACSGNDEIQHINERSLPATCRPKDFVTHNLFWKRSGKDTHQCLQRAIDTDILGFKDPYPKEEQAMFAKW